MMRSALLFSLSVLAAVAASAQTAPILRAQSRYEGSGGYSVFTDSTRHVHSNNRNSTILADRDIRTYSHNGIYNADTSWFYTAGNKYNYVQFRTFNAAGLLTRLTRKDSVSSSTFLNDDLYVYNPTGLPDTITKWGAGMSTGLRDVYDYDNNGNILHTMKYEWNSGISAWQPWWQLTYTYNNGKVTEVTSEFWDLNTAAWKNNYIDSFLATGVGSDSVYIHNLWDGATYHETGRHRYKRDAGNRVLSDSVYQNGNYAEATYYTYDAQGRLTADSLMYWYAAQQVFVPGLHREYRYNAQSALTVVKTFDPSPFTVPTVYASLDSFTYNNFNQVISRRNYDSTSGQLTASVYPDRQYFYYGPSVNGVPEVATAQSTLHLYPIPATTYINLSMQFTKPQPFSVRIFDMQGRLVNNWQEPAQKNYSKQIPLTGMAPGQYTVHILAGNESVSRQFMVVR